MRIEVLNKDIRDAFFDQLYKLGAKDKNLVFLTADADAFSLRRFKEDFPSQFVNVGVAEQNMMLVAAGLAMAGKKVFVYSITPFVSMRCLEQINVNICNMNLDVSIIGLGCGFSFSFDGPSHHATQDLAIMRTLPNLTILEPSEEVSAVAAFNECYRTSTPMYVRLDKGAYDKNYVSNELENGFKEYSNKSKIKLITSGYCTQISLEISEIIRQNAIEIDVINLYRLKPLNIEGIREILHDSSNVITIEENSLMGGIGSMVAEIICDHQLHTRLKRFGVKDKFVFEYGTRPHLMGLQGLSVNNIRDEIIEFINTPLFKKDYMSDVSELINRD
tara:strand:- start:4031 stop:5026 length:996 start_codon:yes stop_codon:yes gene_type:complete